MLREILSALHDRYVEPVSLPDLARQSLSGLGRLAPGVAPRPGRAEWRLVARGRTIGTWPTPAAQDAAGWAALVAGLAASAHATPGLRGSGQAAMMAALTEPLTTALDPYTRYVPPAEARAAQGRRRGEGGIGVRVVPAEEGAAISEVIPESPADHAGLVEGDRILTVDGTRLRGLSEMAIARLLAGDEDTRVVLNVRPRRGGSARQIAIIRTLVVAPSVEREHRAGVAIFRLTTFNRLTDQHLARALLDAQTAMDPPGGIVLDLRGNRGGLLRQAVGVADLFLAQGEIAATRGRHPDAARTYVAAGSDLANRIPLVVLVDGSTASAAEIVAAGLQARGRAVVVGSSTLGKGMVQTVIRLPDGGELILTWSRVLAPPGLPLNELGVVPVLCTSNGRDATLRQLAALGAGTPAATGPAAAPARGGADQGKDRLDRSLDRTSLVRLRQSCPPRDGSADDLDAALALLGSPPALATALGLAPGGPATPAAIREHLAGAN